MLPEQSVVESRARATSGPSAGRFFTTLLLGPLLGTLVFLLYIVVTEMRDGANLAAFVTHDLLEFVGFGYVFGLVSAFAAAVLMAVFVSRDRSPGRQLIAAIAIGAVTGSLGVGAVLFGLGALAYVEWSFHLVSASAGAVALLVTTLIFLRSVRPRFVMAN